MKKSIVIAIVALLGLSSCKKKDVKCICTIKTEKNNPYSPTDSVNGVVHTNYLYITVPNSTVKQAKKTTCADNTTKDEGTAYYYNSVTNQTTIKYQTTKTTTCVVN